MCKCTCKIHIKKYGESLLKKVKKLIVNIWLLKVNIQQRSAYNIKITL